MRAFTISLSGLLPLAAAALLTGAPGCTTEAACFENCVGVDGPQDGGESSGGRGGGQPNLGGNQNGGGFNIAGNQNRAGMGQLEDAGTACDGVDTQTDLNNCGMCGNVCIFTGAGASCIDGECVIGACFDSRYDLDGDPNNGCEYACAPAEDEAEVCNYLDDDCDGVKDNGFDLESDAENCGVCGNACELLHATASSCVDGDCVIETCEPGWFDADGLDPNGCEYQCTPTGKDGAACAPNDATCGTIEYCDEYDNDCNGSINDGDEASGGPEGGQACTDFCANGVCQGQCTAGITTCVGKDLVCIPGQGPTLETCDGEDNDCDGVDDNGFNLSTDPNNCGACGNSCINALPNAVATCTDPAGATPPGCTIASCKSGYANLTNAPGCEYRCPKFPTSAETCNGIDDDCNGVIDDASAIAGQKPAVQAFCNNGRPLAGTPCANATVTCGGANGWSCTYGNAAVEVDAMTKKVRVIEAKCDDLDGNCDGQIDEAFLNKDDECSVGLGRCGREGVYDCTANGTATECKAVAVASDARDEECNGIDDNCDGQVDERNPVGNLTCYTGPNGAGAHPCAGYKDPMVQVGSTWIYTFEASRPDATAIDPGFDDTRACSKQGVMPWTSVSQTQAKAVCEALPTSVANTKMRLCGETEWEAACRAGNATTSPLWAYSEAATTYDDDLCNDAAAGINAPWVTGFVNAGVGSKRCRTATTNIFDLTGNVAEWTNTCITVLGKQYCRVRGGSFLSQGPATACNFSFVLNIPSFVNFDLGFRCCSSAAP